MTGTHRQRHGVRRWAATAVTVLLTAAAGVGSAHAATQPATWNFRQADVPAAQALGNDGAGVTVAVVDTWVDTKHPDFGGRVYDEVYCVNGGGSCRDHTFAPDSCAHGTHVAGTVASARYGVAPQARILAVQVLTYDPSSGECSGSGSDIAAGIRYAVAHHAQVINLSVGDLVPLVFQDSDVTAAIQAASAAGVIVAVAAGNQALPLTDSYGQDVLLVAATGPSGQLASYSDYGGSVSLAAPGGDSGGDTCTPQTCVLSTTPHDTYGLLQGTSMATPHVAGTAALLLAQAPGRGAAGVVEAMEATAHPLSGAGHGLLDAAAALRLHAPRAAMSTAATTGTMQGQQPATSAQRSGTAGSRPTAARQPAAAANHLKPGVVAPPSQQAPKSAPAGSTPPTLAPSTRPAVSASARHAPSTGPAPTLVALAAGLIVLAGAALVWARRRPRGQLR